ncbi:MAG: KpsF/GutQ family sugar-phosphate isomerase [Wolinella sp.]
MADYIADARAVLELEADEILRARADIGNGFLRALDIIYGCKGKVIVMGVGKSGLVGAKIAATFASTGTQSFFLHPTEAMHGDLGMIGGADVVLAISYSGESAELLATIPHLKRFKIPLIAMSRSENSSLSRESDAHLSIAITREACPLNAAPTSSTTLTLALGDALAVCLMKMRNFKESDFASFHPGGALGRRLFVKVSDLMQCENLPLISPEASLKEAIIVMSDGRLGSAIIVENDKLLGILSDGDLRRAMMRSDFSLDACAMEYATKNPRYCDDGNMLASMILRQMEEGKIQLLVITDSEKNVRGVIHLHRLIEAGIS